MSSSSLFTVATPIPPDIASELSTHPPLLQQLLYRRGITTATDAAQFLSPSYNDHLHNPLLLHDIVPATDRIHAAIAAGERIAIFSDYDCDGIPGAVVLYDFFTAIGYQTFENYIPHRHYEGFGLSVAAVDTLATAGVTLIITIDCGTVDIEAIAHAKERGIDVVVTDHHEPATVLPEAVAIVNPKLGSYPFPHLCGAGVVYKLVQALIETGTYELLPGREKWWLDMVGIATIADMVPLVGENRVLASYGLTVLRKSRRPGLQQLLKKARANQRYLTEDDIGFTIGPRINAASRMDAPDAAFQLLSATDEGEAGAHVAKLESLNNERKGSVAVMTRELHQYLNTISDIPDVLVFGNPRWRPSLVGLTANTLAEELQRPVFLWGRDGNDVVKGSCRSGGATSVVRLMEQCREAFHEFGGHHAAGGFSVKDEAIFSLGDDLNQSYQTLGLEAAVYEPVIVDAEVSLDAVYREIREVQKPLAPFGTGNPKPLFAFRHVTPLTVTQFGKQQEHLKLTFQTSNGSLEAIAFFKTPAACTKTPAPETACTLLAYVEESFFMGRHQLRLRIVDIC